MEKPTVVINGVVYSAGNPKAAVWRHISEFSFTAADDVVLEMAKIIAEVFADEAVTTDAVLENVELQDVVKLYRQCCNYVLSIFTTSMESIEKNG